MVLIAEPAPTLRQLRRLRQRHQHRQLSPAEIGGEAQVPAPPADAPPVEPPTKAPVVPDIVIGVAIALLLRGMQRLILAPAAAAV